MLLLFVTVLQPVPLRKFASSNYTATQTSHTHTLLSCFSQAPCALCLLFSHSYPILQFFTHSSPTTLPSFSNSSINLCPPISPFFHPSPYTLILLSHSALLSATFLQVGSLPFSHSSPTLLLLFDYSSPTLIHFLCLFTHSFARLTIFPTLQTIFAHPSSTFPTLFPSSKVG